MYMDVHVKNRYSCHVLTLNPLTWKIWWAPNNASRWQMGFNSAFKRLMKLKFSDMFSKNTQISNFKTVRLVGGEFDHADGSRNRHDDANSYFLQICERAYKWQHGPRFPIMESFSQSDLNRRSFETSTNVRTLLGSTPRHPHKQLLFSRQFCISESSPAGNNMC